MGKRVVGSLSLGWGTVAIETAGGSQGVWRTMHHGRFGGIGVRVDARLWDHHVPGRGDCTEVQRNFYRARRTAPIADATPT